MFLKFCVWMDSLSQRFGSGARGYFRRIAALGEFEKHQHVRMCSSCAVNPVTGKNPWCIECNTRVFVALDEMEARRATSKVS